jgi:hypothetical protein
MKGALATRTRPCAKPRRSRSHGRSQDRTAPPRLSRNPIAESTAFNIATRRPENNFFGWPHHKHVTLATLSGLPHAEQTFTCRMEGVLSWRLEAQRAIRPNVAVKTGGLHASGPEGSTTAGADAIVRRERGFLQRLLIAENRRFDARRGRGKPIIQPHFHAISCVPRLASRRFGRRGFSCACGRRRARGRNGG